MSLDIKGGNLTYEDLWRFCGGWFSARISPWVSFEVSWLLLNSEMRHIFYIDHSSCCIYLHFILAFKVLAPLIYHIDADLNQF